MLELVLNEQQGQGLEKEHRLKLLDGVPVQVLVTDKDLGWPLRLFGIVYERVLEFTFHEKTGILHVEVKR